jgi:hypothetical protein
MDQAQRQATPKTARTQHPAVELMTSKPRPDNTPHPDEVDPHEGTAPDDTPVENPSG